MKELGCFSRCVLFFEFKLGWLRLGYMWMYVIGRVCCRLCGGLQLINFSPEKPAVNPSRLEGVE